MKKGRKLSVVFLSLLIILLPFNSLRAQMDQSFRTLSGHRDAVIKVVVSGNGQYLVSIAADTTIRFWNLQDNSDTALMIFTGHSELINDVAVRSDGDLIVSGSEDKDVRIWSTASKRCIDSLRTPYVPGDTLRRRKPEYPSKVNALIISNNGREIISGHADNDIRVWQVAGYQRKNRISSVLKGASWEISNMDISPDGRYLIGSWADSIGRWDLVVRRIIQSRQAHSNIVTDIAYSAEGNYIITGSEDQTVKIWDAQRMSVIATLNTGMVVEAVAISPDEKYIAVGGLDRNIQIWDMATHKIAARYAGHFGVVNTLSFTPDGTTLISGGNDKTIKMWPINELNIMILYADQIEKDFTTDPRLKPVKGEFEKQSDFMARKDSIAHFKKLIITKYKRIHQEKLSKDSIANVEKIKKSYKILALKIDSIGFYDAENELFKIKVSDKIESVYVPIGDAKAFKDNYKKAKVQACQQLLLDGKTLDLFNIMITHPTKNASYRFGKWRKPYYVKYEFEIEDTNSGG